MIEATALSINQSWNGSTEQKNGPLENFTYRCRGCNNNLTSNDPASQYQRQKIIQNTVRVPASLYTMNLGALNVYELPDARTRVNWNQMSDRRNRHIQTAYIPTRGSSTRSSITRNRPGAMGPGGEGVDIKHNSYYRYLARIKGQKPLRRGVIPDDYGKPFIPFNRAFPIYGGKTVKTSIVNNCNCPVESNETRKKADELIYVSPLQDEILNVTYKFSVGDLVYAIKDADPNGNYYKATIIGPIINGLYEIQFEDGTINYKTVLELLIYFDCSSCLGTEDLLKTLFVKYILDDNTSAVCQSINYLADGGISQSVLSAIQQQIHNNLYPTL
jgi:hypothetical protein